MRALLAITILMLSGFCAQAQDLATQAAQQAAQQATQAAQQQQMQQMQQASNQATQQMMQNLSDASNSANNTAGCCRPAARPTFSAKPGTYSATTTVKIHDATRGAVIYYTMDGWTPTLASTRYTGPVSIDSTTTLNAIAIVPGPYSRRSLVASAKYTITGTQPATAKASPPVSVVASSNVMGSAILRQGTPVHLVFATEVNSKTADVGDKIQLTLAEDVKAGDMVLIAKGAHATATVTQVDKTGAGGAPGNLVFQVESLDANGNTVKLQGSATLEGQPKPPNAAVLVP